MTMNEKRLSTGLLLAVVIYFSCAKELVTAQYYFQEEGAKRQRQPQPSSRLLQLQQLASRKADDDDQRHRQLQLQLENQSDNVIPQPTPSQTAPPTKSLTESPTVNNIRIYDSGTKGGTSWSGTLTGVAEYANNPSHRPIIIMLTSGDASHWFVGFNDLHVTITKVENGKLYLMGRIHVGGSETITNWRRSGLDLRVKVHEMINGESESERPHYADGSLIYSNNYANVEILFGSQPTVHPTTVGQLDSDSPSNKPTNMPTQLPTTLKPTEPTSNNNAAYIHPLHIMVDLCGNSICDDVETPDTCPSDCIAKSFQTDYTISDANSYVQIFTVEAMRDVTICSLDIMGTKTTKEEVMVYTRPEGYKGYETDETAWQLLYDKKIKVKENEFVELNFGELDREVDITAGSRQAFYVWSSKGMPHVEGSGAEGVPLFDGDDSLVINEGIGAERLFGKTIGAAKYSGGIRYYESASAGSDA